MARHQGAPRNKGHNVSLIAAMTSTGMTAALTVVGSIDHAAFETYIERVLGPQLRPGQTVLMNNLRVHKRARTQQLIEARGCTLRFVSTYSPDFAPIEGGFGNLKQLVRKDTPRTGVSLDRSNRRALCSISEQDARGWFVHCGYHLPRQPL